MHEVNVFIAVNVGYDRPIGLLKVHGTPMHRLECPDRGVDASDQMVLRLCMKYRRVTPNDANDPR